MPRRRSNRALPTTPITRAAPRSRHQRALAGPQLKLCADGTAPGPVPAHHGLVDERDPFSARAVGCRDIAPGQEGKAERFPIPWFDEVEQETGFHAAPPAR